MHETINQNITNKTGKRYQKKTVKPKYRVKKRKILIKEGETKKGKKKKREEKRKRKREPLWRTSVNADGSVLLTERNERDVRRGRDR